MNEISELTRFHKAFGDETRLRLVALLAQQERGNALCVGRLAHELDTTASNISQHLRVLKSLNLVHKERRGYRIHYFLDEEQLLAYHRASQRLLGVEPVGDAAPRVQQQAQDARARSST